MRNIAKGWILAAALAGLAIAQLASAHAVWEWRTVSFPNCWVNSTIEGACKQGWTPDIQRLPSKQLITYGEYRPSALIAVSTADDPNNSNWSNAECQARQTLPVNGDPNLTTAWAGQGASAFSRTSSPDLLEVSGKCRLFRNW
jgi:hypothetical protein